MTIERIVLGMRIEQSIGSTGKNLERTPLYLFNPRENKNLLIIGEVWQTKTAAESTWERQKKRGRGEKQTKKGVLGALETK